MRTELASISLFMKLKFAAIHANRKKQLDSTTVTCLALTHEKQRKSQKQKSKNETNFCLDKKDLHEK